MSRRNAGTKKPRNAVWMRMAAHSWRTAMKSLAGARVTVATAAVNGSAGAATEDASSEASDAAERWLPPLEPRQMEPWSPEEVRHSFHLRPLPRNPPWTDGSCSLSWTGAAKVAYLMKILQNNSE